MNTAFGSRNVIEKSLFDWGVWEGRIKENENQNEKDKAVRSVKISVS